jgi:pimeloyl-ACP methyl ester carboxylesterase
MIRIHRHVRYIRPRLRRGAVAAIAAVLVACAVPQAAHANVRMIEGDGGVMLAVTEIGPANATPLILVHSFQASTLNWQRQLQSPLAETFRLIAPDLRGHGASAKPWDRSAYVETRPWAEDLAAVLRASGARKPIIVAASYGGLFVMDYIRHHGTNAIGGIVFLGSAAGLLPPPPPPEDTPERRARIARSTAADLPTIIAWTEGFIAAIGANPPISEAEKQTLALSALLTPHYVRAFLRDHPTDNSDIATALENLPVLFIIGDKDVATPVDLVRRAAAKVPGARVRVYEGVGGLTYWSFADRLNADIAAFAAEIEPR